MKKLLFILLATSILSCSRTSDGNNSVPAQVSKDIPSSYIGKWTVYEYKSIGSIPNQGYSTTGLPYYIIFNSDNTINIKTPEMDYNWNATFSATASFSIKNSTSITAIINSRVEGNTTTMDVYFSPQSDKYLNYSFVVKKN